MLDRTEIMRRISAPRNFRWQYIEKLEALVGAKMLHKKFNSKQTKGLLTFMRAIANGR